MSSSAARAAATVAGANWRSTRWREDATRDCWGMFVYLRDVGTGEFWSTAYQPTLKMTKGYEAIFTQARAEFRHRQAGIEVHTEISVSPEDDVELRRITITNRSPVTRQVELTSYSGSGARQAGRGRGASGVQQSFRADGIRAQIFRPALHAPRPFPGGKTAVVAASDASPGRGSGRNFLRDGPLPICRSGRQPRQSGGDANHFAAVQHGRFGARSDHCPAAHGHFASQWNRDH